METLLLRGMETLLSINQQINQSINQWHTQVCSRPATKAAITQALQLCLLDSNLSTHHLSSAQASVTDQTTTPELAWKLIRYAWNYKDAAAIKFQAWSGLHFSCATLLKVEWIGNVTNQNVLLWHRLYTQINFSSKSKAVISKYSCTCTVYTLVDYRY